MNNYLRKSYLEGGNIMSKICYGCGSKLQYKDLDKEGYIPKDKYDEGDIVKDVLNCFIMGLIMHLILLNQ